MKTMLTLITLLVLSPASFARITTVQELRYLGETLGPIAEAGGYALVPDSISVHGYSAREEVAPSYQWWNTPAGNQDHTVIFKVTKDGAEQWRTISFMSQSTRLGRECRLHNATSRRLTSAFDGRETCVTLYLRPKKRVMVIDPTMQNIRVPHPSLWDAFGSKRP